MLSDHAWPPTWLLAGSLVAWGTMLVGSFRIAVIRPHGVDNFRGVATLKATNPRTTFGAVSIPVRLGLLGAKLAFLRGRDSIGDFNTFTERTCVGSVRLLDLTIPFDLRTPTNTAATIRLSAQQRARFGYHIAMP